MDVAVVGGGYTGLAAARRLARAGVGVAVLEAGPIGGGASSVNGGMTIVGLKPGLAELVRRHGEPLARRLWDASLASVDLVEKLVAEEGIDCHFRRDGAAALGFNRRDRDRFTSAGWMDRHLGHQQELIPFERIHEVVGSDRCAAALVDRQSGGLHPARYVYGLARAAARAGAILVEHSQVHRLERREGVFRLETVRGAVRAGQVLLATNGYTGRLIPALRRRVFPGGSYIVVTEPLPGDQAERLVPAGRMLWTARWFLNYFRLTPDRRLLMGGRNDLSVDLDLLESGRALRRSILGFFPELADVAVTHTWGGRLGITFDLMPHIGRLEGAWYALGYSGHGVALATYLGEEVAGLITGQTEASPFAEIPHPTHWWYRGRPWFLPGAAAWYRLLDGIRGS
ncbi:MAG: NAD(P)/FAD-dependent oxidoreductase [Acidimicrobiia bacterium]